MVRALLKSCVNKLINGKEAWDNSSKIKAQVFDTPLILV
jgi:hypothetical protein